MNEKKIAKKVRAAYSLLNQKTTSRKKFEAIRKLVKGINPKIDKELRATSFALKRIEKFKRGKVIELATEALPENTKEEKKRKIAIILFWRYYKQLKREVGRVRKELGLKKKQKLSTEDRLLGAGKLVAFAKGPWGLITLVAALIVAGGILVGGNKKAPETTTEKKLTEEVFDDSGPSYWIEEGEAYLANNQVNWGIHIHEESDETRASNVHVPATGAEVIVELRSKSGVTTLSGTVDEIAWAAWDQAIPDSKTEMYIVDIKDKLPWAKTDQKRWKNTPLATYP